MALVLVDIAYEPEGILDMCGSRSPTTASYTSSVICHLNYLKYTSLATNATTPKPNPHN